MIVMQAAFESMERPSHIVSNEEKENYADSSRKTSFMALVDLLARARIGRTRCLHHH